MTKITKHKNQNANTILAIVFHAVLLICFAWSLSQLFVLISNRAGSQLPVNDLTLFVLSIVPILTTIAGYFVGFYFSKDNNKLASVVTASFFALILFVIIVAFDFANSVLALITNLTIWAILYATIAVVLVLGSFWYSNHYTTIKNR